MKQTHRDYVLSKPTYAEQNAGKMRAFRITNPGSKHWRHERNGNDIEFVMYSAIGLGCRSTIMLTEESYKNLRHLGLVEVAEQIVSKPSVHIPADWSELALADKKLLVIAIGKKDEKHSTHAQCNDLITAYIEASK